MSHDATNWAIKQRGLKPATKILLWYLADCHNPSMGCFPSQEFLIEQSEMSERSVRNHLEELERLGLISKTLVRDHGKRWAHTEYKLFFDVYFEPPAKSAGGKATGKTASEPPANSGTSHRQNLPTNPVNKPVNKPVKKDLSEFDQFLVISPSKEGLVKARVAFKEAREKVSFETLIDSMQAYRETCERQNKTDRYILHPAKWLTDERWTDEPDQPCAKSPAAKSAAISAATLKYYADILNGNEPIHPSLISSSLADDLYQSGQVTAQRLRERLPA